MALAGSSAAVALDAHLIRKECEMIYVVIVAGILLYSQVAN